MRQKLPIEIRVMRPYDLHDVFAIEKQSLEDPWTEAEIRDALRSKNVNSLVAVRHGVLLTVVGFAFVGICKTSLSIWNLAVHEDWRYKGVGSQLIDHEKELLTPKRNVMEANVFEMNLDAQLFFKQMGFKCTGIERNYIRGKEYDRWPTHDAYHFEFTRPADDAETCDDEENGRAKRKATRDR